MPLIVYWNNERASRWTRFLQPLYWGRGYAPVIRETRIPVELISNALPALSDLTGSGDWRCGVMVFRRTQTTVEGMAAKAHQVLWAVCSLAKDTIMC